MEGNWRGSCVLPFIQYELETDGEFRRISLVTLLGLDFCEGAGNQFGKLLPILPTMGFPCSSVGKESACSADLGLIPGLGKSPGEGNGNRLQYPCLENLMDKGAWWAAVHGVAKSWARLSN